MIFRGTPVGRRLAVWTGAEGFGLLAWRGLHRRARLRPAGGAAATGQEHPRASVQRLCLCRGSRSAHRYSRRFGSGRCRTSSRSARLVWDVPQASPFSRRELHRRTSGRALTSRLRRCRVHAAVNTFAKVNRFIKNMSRCRHPAAGGRQGVAVALSGRGVVSPLRRRPSAASFGTEPHCSRYSRMRSPFRTLGALLARQPAVAKRWQQHLIASPFGTIHAATFSLPRPTGTSIPHRADLCPGEFRPGRHHRLDRQAVARRSDGANSVSKANRKAKRDFAGRAPARSDAASLPPGARYRVRAAGRDRCHIQER